MLYLYESVQKSKDVCAYVCLRMSVCVCIGICSDTAEICTAFLLCIAGFRGGGEVVLSERYPPSVATYAPTDVHIRLRGPVPR